MSTYAVTEPELSMAVDDFAALEQRVLRMVQLLKSERQARTEAERRAAELQHALDAHAADSQRSEEELESFKREREEVRGRVERLLKQLDEISA